MPSLGRDQPNRPAKPEQCEKSPHRPVEINRSAAHETICETTPAHQTAREPHASRPAPMSWMQPAQASLPHRHRTLWRVWRHIARHRVHRDPRRHRENPHPSRRPQHRLHRLPPRTDAPCATSATPGLPIPDAVLTAPAGAPQPRCASPPAPLGLHRLPDIRSPLPAPNRVTSTANCLFPHRHRTRQRPHRYSHNYVNRRVVLPIRRGIPVLCDDQREIRWSRGRIRHPQHRCRSDHSILGVCRIYLYPFLQPIDNIALFETGYFDANKENRR